MSKVSNPSAEVSSEANEASQPAVKAAYIKEAIEILRSPRGDAKRILKVAKELNKRDEFGYAWRILAKALALPGIQNEPDYLEFAQKAALATYKDVNLPLEKRLDDALTILKNRAGLTDNDGRITSRDKETLGLAGAIWKRKWEADNRREHLEESFSFYERAYKEEPSKEYADEGYTGVNADQGYTAINAAYVSDMLGYLEARTDPDSVVVKNRRADARAIRERIVAEVPRLIEPPLADKKPLSKFVKSNADFKKYWFFYGTVGEAHFGLGNYDEAIEWLVTKPEEAQAQAERLRRMVDSPVLTQVKARFDGIDVYDVEPAQLPDVLGGRPVVIYGKWRGDAVQAAGAQLVVEGRSAEGAWRSEVAADAGEHPAGTALRHLWARQRIAMLSDQEALEGGSAQKAAITELGLKYSLLTQYTSFIAVDRIVRNPNPALAPTVDTPSRLPQGVSPLAIGAEVPSTPEPSAWLALLVVAGILVATLVARRDRR